MSNYLIMFSSIFFGCTLILPSASAEDTSTSTATTSTPSENQINVTKDNWLNTVKLALPDLICKGFEEDPQLKKRLDDIKMTHARCITSIPESIDKCQQQLYANIPAQITSDAAAVWAKSLGECIGKDFAMKYLVPKTD